MDLFDIAGFQAASEAVSNWRDTWPFGPGYAEGWISTVLKFGLILVIFLAIAGLLRFLFGPGGFMRDKEFDRPGETSAGEGGQDRADDPRNTDGPHA